MFFVVNVLGNISHWLIVCFSVDRFIAIAYPLKSIGWLTARKTKICITSVCSVALVKNLHYLWTTDFFYNPKTGSAICAFGLKNKALWVSYYQTFEASISSFLPFFFIALCNVMIIRKIRSKRNEAIAKNRFKSQIKSNVKKPTSIKENEEKKNVEQFSGELRLHNLQHSNLGFQGDEDPVVIGDKSTNAGHPTFQEQQVQQSTNTADMEKQDKKNDQTITRILLLVSTIFIVTTSPLLIFRLYFAKKDISNSDAHTQALYTLGHHICHKLWYTNNGINFFLYCWSSKSFRKDLKEILRRKYNKSQKPKTSVINASRYLTTSTSSSLS